MANDKGKQEDREKSRDLGALRQLWPFMAPYTGLMAASILALVMTAIVSLTLPIAGSTATSSPPSAIAALLALGTGLRYYLVTRLGERVVADIRKAVFDRVIGMSRPSTKRS
jgi:ATP-binding cassette subfamily B protein